MRVAPPAIELIDVTVAYPTTKFESDERSVIATLAMKLAKP